MIGSPPPPQDIGRAALVTGAARRIGRVIARALAQDGWAVAVHYGSAAEDARTLVTEIEAAGGRAVALACDLEREEEVVTLIDRAAAALGPLSCLVNNASVFERDSPETESRVLWDRHMAVNLRAPFVLSQRFARQLPAGAAGSVINILDQRVWNLTPFFTSYTVSKAGLWALTQTLALALAPRIRVNAVGPGPTLASSRQSPEQFARQWQGMPLSRQVQPQEIADGVRYLLAAPSVTGQMIAIDAGQHLGWSAPQQGRDGDE